MIKSIPEALAQTDLVCASVNVGSTRSGINMDAVAEMGQAVKKASELDFMTNAKMVIFCNAVEDNPFMAGGFCGVSEPDTVINVGVSGPGVVKKALEKSRVLPWTSLPKRSSKQRSKLRAWVKWSVPLLQNVSAFRLASSICRLRRRLPLGTPLRRFWKKSVLNKSALTARRQLLPCSTMPLKGGIMACNHVGGLSGAFIPVSEDAGMIDAVNAGTLTLSKLEAMTAVCSVGLDMIAVPGDTPAETISAMIADEAAIGMINNKTTAVRVIPVPGKKVGETVEFGGLLGHAPIMGVNPASSADMIHRGGLIPAPIHSFKN